MKIEKSAGGIVFRKIKKGLEILLLKDQNDNWTFPKGLIEKDEDRIKAAKREIAEEVGLKTTKFVAEIDNILYYYRWNDKIIKKTVYYYLFEHTGNESPIPQEEEGIQQVKWFSPRQAIQIIGYKKTNIKVLKSAIEKMKKELIKLKYSESKTN